MNAATIARSITAQTSFEIAPERVTICSDGYAVSGLRREAALVIAAKVVGAFAADPEAGLPMVRICTGWRQTDGHTVRVTIEREIGEAESLARVTGSVGATVVHEHRDATTGQLVTDSVDTYRR